MRTISPSRTGFVLGAVMALWHTAWVVLVAIGAASAVMNFILRLHFIDLEMAIMPFRLLDAVALVALTGTIGFVIGAVFAAIWNWLTTDESAAARPSGRHAAA